MTPCRQDTIGWGLLGTGGICGRMAWALTHVADARLAAVGSRDGARAQAFVEAEVARHPVHAQRGPVRAHGDYEALVNDPGVDVVYIGTPNPDHVASALMALAAGKAVLCEKPFMLNREQAERVVALARARGAFLMEAMWTRLLPVVVEARRLVDEGAIGEPLHVQADFGFAAQLPPTHRVFDPALGGGSLLDLGIYPLSLAACLLGPVAGVHADARIGATGVDEHLAFQLRHARGGITQGMCSLRTTTTAGATVFGTGGRIELEPPFYGAQALRVVPHAAEGFAQAGPARRVELPWQGDGFVPQVREVHRCLRAGWAESPMMPLDESVALVGWMDEMRRQVGVRYPGEAAP